MKYIDLPNNKQVIVDDEDFDYLNQFKWNFNSRYVVRNKHNKCYGKCKGKGCSKVFIHRVIMNTPKGMETDHINGNTLDNRKINLRICTRSQNAFNSSVHRDTHSGYKGVYWNSINKKWIVTIRRKYFGSFSSKELAAQIYNENVVDYYGEYSRLNNKYGGLS